MVKGNRDVVIPGIAGDCGRCQFIGNFTNYD